jgi:hypothetical protein
LVSRSGTKVKKDVVNTPFFKNTEIIGEFYSNNFQIDEAILPLNLTQLDSFSILQLSNLNANLDESYESLKYINHFVNKNNKVLLNNLNNFNQNHSQTFFANTSRSNYDDFS